MEDFTDPRGSKLQKAALGRGWLLVLLVMAVFIVLTKIFPGQPSGPTAPQLTHVDTPSH